MTHTSPRITQEYCPPVALEYGTPPDVALMRDPDLESEVFSIGGQIESAHVRDTRELDTGEAAERAMQALGCAACQLGNSETGCIIKEELTDRKIIGEANREFLDKVTMLASAPNWLNAARINMAGLTNADLATMAGDPERLKSMEGTGELDALLGSVENTFEGTYTKKELPELALIPGVPDHEELPAHTITTPNTQYTVIDASEAVGFSQSPMDEASYGVITAKILNRMSELDGQGNPQIYTADKKMQKLLANTAAPVFEARMTGKNRMYFTVAQAQEDQAARIVILGSHGGDESTQISFINNNLI